ncbi:hypothetical protein LOK49_LG05G01715 [Camellia lanceoleosa]|uniref:Uncharacterized protein n=1 Tax=Camellia lanceoleosa TaxID=1840588 RepID=A0ACC0HRV4_9ERIC|nr:hypothetical protein LOK49_LG05G01715 [Camellia lanceoleosa]
MINGTILRSGALNHLSSISATSSSTNCQIVAVVHTQVEVDWFRLLDTALVGKVERRSGKGMSFATISDWIGKELVAHHESVDDDLGLWRLAEQGGLSSQATSSEAEDGEVKLAMVTLEGVSWANCVEQSELPSTDRLALVLQPLATEGGGSKDLLGQHQNMVQNSGGLDGPEVPSSEPIANINNSTQLYLVATFVIYCVIRMLRSINGWSWSDAISNLPTRSGVVAEGHCRGQAIS